MIRRIVFIFGIIISVPVLVLGGWLSLYPERADPKNLGYILWKHNLYSMAIPDAAAAMIGDPNRDSLVVGKSKEELNMRFGHLHSVSEAPSYLRHCYHEYGEEPGHEPRFIADSDWMIIFAGNRAIRLVNIKSCY
jgi:hypothetical protein